LNAANFIVGFLEYPKINFHEKNIGHFILWLLLI
jgi:hypothetical protein